MNKLAWLAAILAVAVSFEAAAQCKEDGGTAYCIGPVVGPYRYQVSDGFTSAQGSDEASTIEAFRQKYMTDNNACTVTLTDNLPSEPSVPIGIGHSHDGDYAAALADGSTQFGLRPLPWTPT
jgi:hypothetical protein